MIVLAKDESAISEIICLPVFVFTRNLWRFLMAAYPRGGGGRIPSMIIKKSVFRFFYIAVLDTLRQYKLKVEKKLDFHSDIITHSSRDFYSKNIQNHPYILIIWIFKCLVVSARRYKSVTFVKWWQIMFIIMYLPVSLYQAICRIVVIYWS